MEESNPPIKQEPIEELTLFAQELPRKNQSQVEHPDKQKTHFQNLPSKIKLEPQIASIHDWLSKLPAAKPVVEKPVGPKFVGTINDTNPDGSDGGIEIGANNAVPKSTSKTKQTAIRSNPTKQRKTAVNAKQQKAFKKSVKKPSISKSKEIDKSSSSVNENTVKSKKQKVTKVERKKVDYYESSAAVAGPSTPRKKRNIENEEAKESEESRMLDESDYSDKMLEKKREFQSLLDIFDQKVLDAYNAFEDLTKELNKSAPGLKLMIEPPKVYNKRAIYTLMGLNEDEDSKKYV
ncbi:7901_t:CDS:2 [Acaulospora morrowiae]|uniref:7901_t:CDS:1 n=1 Tax=Acaulospora morrowiae TaxID=94023 RepID=A0A9N9BFT0_9GLOM|nr:7901_t:CDS:2 [Acaulospora morrowiae]